MYCFRETKIVVKGQSAKHLEELQAKAQSLNLATYLVEDAGRTQVCLTALNICLTKRSICVIYFSSSNRNLSDSLYVTESP